MLIKVRIWEVEGGLQIAGTYPIPLEAFLRAEITVLHAQLEARGALKSACIVLTVCAHTFPLRCRFGIHDCAKPSESAIKSEGMTGLSKEKVKSRGSYEAGQILWNFVSPVEKLSKAKGVGLILSTGGVALAS
jgi:hypothetical protein